jgi:hypothetical protein
MHREHLRIIGVAIAPMLALCSWISLNPYFLWGSLRHMAIAGMISGILALVAFVLGDRPRREEVIGFALIALFIVYISVLPKTDGTLTRWYFVLPTMLALAIYSDDRRRKVLESFSWIFAASLIPGIVVSVSSIASIPIDFEYIPLANPVMAAAGGHYLHVPGALLLGGNSAVLPWGGVLYRLCAVYDEPGMVGTIAVFLLAGNRFRLNSPVYLTIFVGGVLSCSLAFCVMAVIGFMFRAVLAKSRKSLLPLAITGLVGLTVVGAFTPHASSPPVINNAAEIQVEVAPSITSITHSEEVKLVEATPSKIHASAKIQEVVIPEQSLRQTQYINNRSLPEMDRLVDKYWKSDARTILLGVSSDASVTYGGVSQVVTRLLTDFGLIGALLFVSSLISLAFAITKKAESRIWVLLFFALFALSIYQRPIVWMPYAFTFFICCSTVAGRKSPASVKVDPL